MSENDIVIRHLRDTDFDHGFPEVLEVLAPVNRVRILTGVTSRIYVALDGKRVVGCATVFFERKFIHGGGLVAHIEDVAVHAYYQGQGIGCSLVGRCMDEARAAGCYKVILNCAEDVRGFYEQLGFYSHQTQMRYDIGGVQKRPANGA
jgi:glucosamine-phosphate N-acetyltransferase